jgi:hypothetical protein
VLLGWLVPRRATFGPCRSGSQGTWVYFLVCSHRSEAPFLGAKLTRRPKRMHVVCRGQSIAKVASNLDDVFAKLSDAA